MTQFKTHIWGLVEFHTPALFHCPPSLLSKLDRLQVSFLEKLGISEEEALLTYNFAPFKTRRDIAMLGFLYKIAHGHAHPAFNSLFPFAPAQEGRHDKQLGNHAHRIRFRFQLWRRSVFGLVIYFNRLPQHVVGAEDVFFFKHGCRIM